MAKFLNQWDQYYGATSASTTSGTWYGGWSQYEKERYYFEQAQYEKREQERWYRREQMLKMVPPPAYYLNEPEPQAKALMALMAPKKEETPLDWLHKRVNEVCDDALTAVA